MVVGRAFARNLGKRQTYSAQVEEADEAIANEHEEAKRSAGAHDDEGDQPLRQALISKSGLQSQERSVLIVENAHADSKERNMHGAADPKDA